MESPKKLVCSSSARLPYQEAIEVQEWSENIQRAEGNCLMDGYVFSLPEEVHVDLGQNKLTKLASLCELVSGPNKRRFYDLYGQIAYLITVKVDEPLIKAAIQFWDPSHRCFTFNEEDMMPITEEYAMLIRLNLQCFDKVYYQKTRLGIRKKLAKIMGIEPVNADGFLVDKEGSIGLNGSF